MRGAKLAREAASPQSGPPSPERGLTPPGRAAGAGRGRQAQRLLELAGPNIKGAAGGLRGAGRGGDAGGGPGRWEGPIAPPLPSREKLRRAQWA